MSKGQDVEAYTKILKFQNKRYGLGIRDIVIMLFGLLVITGGTFWMASFATTAFSTILFIVLVIYILLLAITFADYALGFGLFNQNHIIYTGSIVIITVLFTVILTFFAESFFPNGSAENIPLVGMVIYLAGSFVISYFIMTATPTRQGRDEMIRKLNEIREEIEQIPVGKLGSKDATLRGLKWLQFQQRQDGIWGDDNPLYETSHVLRTFASMKSGLNYSWKRIVKGQEEIRTTEQTYYLVLDALDTAAIEPNYEMLFPFQTITEIDPDQVELDAEVFEDFKEELNAISEWEFVQSIEDFDDSKFVPADIPIIYPMSDIFYLKGNLTVAQQCADIFSQTFDILIRRSQTRFTIQGEKEISNLLLGKMYGSLTTMLRGHQKINQNGDMMDMNTDSSSEEKLDDLEINFDLSDMSLPSTDIEVDDDDPAMPSFDFPDQTSSSPDSTTSGSSGGFDINLPDPSMDLGDDSDSTPKKIKIEVSMASIRNYIRSLQAIDGSWGSSIETTAECLLAVLDEESPESDFIKLGLHYLLALQEKNGSWQNDLVLTSKVLRTMIKINNSMSLGGF